MNRCLYCNTPFEPARFNPGQKYCSPKCRCRVKGLERTKRERETRGTRFINCEECQILFAPQSNHQTYCSIKCREAKKEDSWERKVEQVKSVPLPIIPIQYRWLHGP